MEVTQTPCPKCRKHQEYSLGLASPFCEFCGADMNAPYEAVDLELIPEAGSNDVEIHLIANDDADPSVPNDASQVVLDPARLVPTETGGPLLFSLVVWICVTVVLGSVATVGVVGMLLSPTWSRQNAITKNASTPTAPSNVEAVPEATSVKEATVAVVPEVHTPITPLDRSKATSLPDSKTIEPRFNTENAPLERCKAATVFLKVQGEKTQSSGSGFLVMKEGKIGKIVTNAHVVDSAEGKAKSIDCVFHSGRPNEFTVPCEIVGLDHEQDLAILRVESAWLPKVLKTNESRIASEAQPIFILGFPFGDALKTNKGNPNLSISKSIVSSIRRDNSGSIVTLQLDGGVNPGNSGGPIVSEDGELLGIAVAKLRTADIGFAIPPQAMFQMLAGRLAKPVIRDVASRNGKSKFGITVELLDPDRNIQFVNVLVIKGSALGLPLPMRGVLDDEFTEWQRYPLMIEGSIASGEFEIPKEAVNAQYQLSWHTKDGSIYHSQPADIRPSPRPGEMDVRWDVIKLPSRFSEVDVAAGGRYLVFHLPKLKRLDIFDTLKRQVIQSISVNGEGICTAGMDRIFFLRIATKELFQWSIDQFELLRTDTLDFSEKPTMLAMGSASRGPLFIGLSNNNYHSFQILDSSSLKPIGVDISPHSLGFSKESQVRVSGSGNAIAFANSGMGHVLLVDPQVSSPYPARETENYLIPSHDGERFYSPDCIRYRDSKKAKVDLTKCICNIPSLDGNGYLSVIKPDSDLGKKPFCVTIRSNQGTVSHKDLSIPLFILSNHRPLDHRIHLYNQNKMLLVLPETNNEIHIRPL